MSVGPSHTSWILLRDLAEFEQFGLKNMKQCHLKNSSSSNKLCGLITRTHLMSLLDCLCRVERKVHFEEETTA